MKPKEGNIVQTVPNMHIRPQAYPKDGLLAQFHDQLNPPVSDLNLNKHTKQARVNKPAFS